MKNKFMFNIVTVTILFLSTSLFGQEYKIHSVHKSHKEYFDSLMVNSPDEYKKLVSLKNMPRNSKSKECNLEKIVFGWHPYWRNGNEVNYQWNLLSDLSYFSYDVDYLTGDPLTTNGWETVNVVDEALANGLRVNLCFTLFSDHAAFFANAAAQQNLIDNLLTLVQNRAAHGVNIDIESTPLEEADNLNNFIVNLADQFHAESPEYQVSIAMPAVDWSNKFNIDLLKDHVDLFVIMGYAYYWSSSSTAGPTGQLYTMDNFNYNQSRSITYYLHEGVPHAKLVLGVPYYGRDWQTTGNSVPASTVGSGTAIFLDDVKDNSTGYYSNKNIEPNSLCAYYNYNNGNPHQAWIDDEETMKYKYDVVLQRDIAGIGIWALGYDDGYTEMWDLIESNFTDCAMTPCSYTIYDMGGPTRNHYNNEDYTFTIAPDDYTDYLALNFQSFYLQAGYDFLWIYDGWDTNAPLIGEYTGTSSPGTVEASGDAITIKLHSDGATTRQGWIAEWTCNYVSVDEISETDINVYPNPASDIIYIDSKGLKEVKIISQTGKMTASYFTSEINISDLANGIYFLKIITEDKISVKKIIINR